MLKSYEKIFACLVKKKKVETNNVLLFLMISFCAVVETTNNENEDDLVDEDEFDAWRELRLHPLLMNAIYKLGFKHPTPIQKACIPAAAHQGKVCANL